MRLTLFSVDVNPLMFEVSQDYTKNPGFGESCIQEKKFVGG